MSRMPGRGASAGSRAICLASRIHGERERHRVPAEQYQPIERYPELRTKSIEACVRWRHKPFDLDQVEGFVLCAVRKQGRGEPSRRQEVGDSRLSGGGGTLRSKQGAVETAFLASATPDCQGIGVGTGITARTEGKPGDNPRAVLLR